GGDRLPLLLLRRRQPAVPDAEMTEGLPEDLAAALDDLARAAADAGLHDPWWVFGGAAMALLGLSDWRVPDIDVLASPGDARRLADALGASVVTDPGEGQFRSRVYARTEGRAV